MSDLIKERINQIFTEYSQKNKDESYAHAMACAWIVADNKGENLKVYDVKEKSTLANYYVLATAQNTIQAQTIANRMKKFLKEKTPTPVNIEGEKEANWILIDFGQVIVHIFLDSTRSIYDLDGLWSAYKQIEIPDEFYFSSRGFTEANSKTTKASDYF